jgi:hypothetical protein
VKVKSLANIMIIIIGLYEPTLWEMCGPCKGIKWGGGGGQYHILRILHENKYRVQCKVATYKL